MSVLLDRPAAGPPTAERDPRDPIARVEALLDPDSLVLIAPPDDSGVVAARGRIGGARVVVYATDAARMGGALGAAGCEHIVDAIDVAVRDRCPVVGLWHCGGARLAEGVTSLDGVGQVFAAIIRASGQVPQLSVILGPAAGGAAYGPALTDLVIMAPAGRVFVTGPDVVRSVTGEEIDAEGLGGADAHGSRSGVVHVLADSEADALARTRSLVGLFSLPGAFDLPGIRERGDLAALLPAQRRRAYDVHTVIDAVLDADDVQEIQAGWARNIVTVLGRLGGRTVGVLANNPIRRGGCLDSLSAEKASRFVRLCDAFGIPMVVLVDVPGYLPGVDQEWGGVVRRGAKLLHAFAEAVVPRVTLVLRKSYGGAYIAMNSRSLGATAVYAWPGAEIAVMGAEAAVGILHRKKLAAAHDADRDALLAELIDEHERTAGGVDRAVSIGVVDGVVDPSRTRSALAGALACAPAGRGRHANIPL